MDSPKAEQDKERSGKGESGYTSFDEGLHKVIVSLVYPHIGKKAPI